MTGVEVIVLSVAAGVTIAAGTSYYLKRRRDKQLRKRIFGKPFSKFKQKRFDQDTGVLRPLSDWFFFVETKGVFTEGVFRISIKAQLLKELSKQSNAGRKIKYDKLEEPVHACACLIKKLLRELPECLISFKLYPQLMDIQKNENDMDVWIKRVNEQLEQLTYRNVRCLKRILSLLYFLQSNSDKNLMTAKNLAVVFGPCMIFSHVPSDAMTFLNDCMDINNFVENMITNESKLLVDMKQVPTKKEQKFLDKELCKLEKAEREKKRKDKKMAQQKEKKEKIEKQKSDKNDKNDKNDKSDKNKSKASSSSSSSSHEVKPTLTKTNSVKKLLLSPRNKHDSPSPSSSKKKGKDLKTNNTLDMSLPPDSPRYGDSSSDDDDEEEDTEEMDAIRARMERGRAETVALSPEMLKEMKKNPFFVQLRNESDTDLTETTIAPEDDDDDIFESDDSLSAPSLTPRTPHFTDEQRKATLVEQDEMSERQEAVEESTNVNSKGDEYGEEEEEEDYEDEEFDFEASPPDCPPPPIPQTSSPLSQELELVDEEQQQQKNPQPITSECRRDVLPEREDSNSNNNEEEDIQEPPEQELDAPQELEKAICSNSDAVTHELACGDCPSNEVDQNGDHLEPVVTHK